MSAIGTVVARSDDFEIMCWRQTDGDCTYELRGRDNDSIEFESIEEMRAVGRMIGRAA